MRFKMISAFYNSKNGFTLIEVLIAIVLLGLAITAIVASNAAFTQVTAQAAQLSTAEFLIEQIRELTALSLYNDLYNLNKTFNPPIDSRQKQLTNLSDYSQTVSIENVSNTNFQQVVANSDFIRVTVKIFYKNSEVKAASWLKAAN